MFLFDPTQDKRFRAACRGKAAGSSGDRDNRLSRQETLLNEAAARVRKFRGLSQSARDDRPLIVILSKFDEWSHLIGSMDDPEPWRRIDGAGVRGLDVDRIHDRSARLRELLARYCPETVAAAEGFAEDVVYIAVSCYDVDGLPRTNNALEQFFGSYRHHERRCSGRKVACPGTVVRGSARLIAAAATRLRPIGPADLIPRDVAAWRSLRASLEGRQAVRALGRGFRRDPEAYLKSLETSLINRVLPS